MKNIFDQLLHDIMGKVSVLYLLADENENSNLNKAIKNLTAMSIIYRDIINSHVNISTIEKVMELKNIKLNKEYSFDNYDFNLIFCAISLIIASDSKISITNKIVVFNYKYDLLSKDNGIINFLLEKYNLIGEIIENNYHIRVN
jgi:hypothetical protein